MAKGKNWLIGGCAGLIGISSFTLGYVKGKQREPAPLVCVDEVTGQCVPCAHPTGKQKTGKD